jgi:hypothetical protein
VTLRADPGVSRLGEMVWRGLRRLVLSRPWGACDQRGKFAVSQNDDRFASFSVAAPRSLASR